MIKRIFSITMILCMLITFAACQGNSNDVNDNNDDADQQDKDNGNENGDNDENKDEDKKDEIDYTTTIDIYLIAGQSNAVGCTRIDNRYAAYQFAPELINNKGFSNVHYAGSARTGGLNFNNNEADWQTTKLGFGSNKSALGPEVGMAKALSSYYNEETGRHAGIIKFAHGGSSLRNVSEGENATGNWVSPSYANELGVSYNDTDVTGGFYRGLLGQVKKNIGQIEEYSGHTKINIVGMYWMQGEHDIRYIEEYKKSFTYFVNDLRGDLAEIMLEFTNGESDCGASDMPVMIGTISSTFAISDSYTELIYNKPFISAQKALAGSINNCYIVDNSKFAITKWNSETGSVEVLGSDRYHWNQSDMLSIGNNVGKAFLKEVVKKK